ncbi:MAG: hypothetical protein A3B70_02750 [Deltaproteobacteria bacterium RIFCSPHIGHO2_02_FULL_40_11]|nr:MAG: hypothetical protein A3B70_02750 [Deltaproteobacteria bacterium RIFCSPHIGHO2_02_FULL_40_11]
MKDEKTKTHVIESDDFLEKLKLTKTGVPCLVLIEGSPLGKKFPLVPPKVRFGRGSRSDLSIDDKSVSGEHAEVIVKGQEVQIVDLKSTNGTYVNDQKISEPMVLKEGDTVRIGTTIFKYLAAGNIESVYHERMRDFATIDSLTQVFNKKYVLEFLKSEYQRCTNQKLPISIVMIDVDHFKKLNDTYGHLAGDYVLKKSCALLKDQVLRSHDVFGRYGGEEFLLVLPEAPLQRACEIAERLRATIAEYAFEYDQKKLSVTISLGVSEADSTIQTPEGFIKKADQALYKAKNAGRNQVCVI